MSQRATAEGAAAEGAATTSVVVFALTPGGAATARRIAAAVGGELRLPSRMTTPESNEASGGFVRVGPALRDALAAGSALVCVMAAGVVVRSLAPVLRGKLVDPPVLVVDECGRFVVPILSGHVGGGNALARHVAAALGAQAVLTTSSDVQGFLGPDMLAVAMDAYVEPPSALLPVAAALAGGSPVDLWYEPTTVGSAAAFLEGLGGYRARPLLAPALATVPTAGSPASAAAVLVSDRVGPVVLDGVPSGRCVRLIPRLITAGVGCTRGTPADSLVAAVREAFSAAGLRIEALRALGSVRAKGDEPGLFAAAEELDVPLVFAGDDQVETEIAARGLAESEWVRASIGVGAASEPAALWAAGPGSVLVQEKIARSGVTVALARGDGGAAVAAREDRWKV
ncbi:MAG: cobalt-precorrin 5A hydrolase [Thermoleophilia bacterium]